jgi:hypothetical protein
MKHCLMKHGSMMAVVAAIVAATVGGSPALAGGSGLETTPDATMPSRPSVAFLAVSASRLHLGMAAAEVTRIMGEPAKTASYRNADIAVQTLDFSAEPIGSKVTLINGRLSGVALDVFRANQDDLPTFTHMAWPGLNSATVLRMLGTPSDVRHHALFGMTLDQMIFRRSGDPDVSIFFVADRLVAKRVGPGLPADIFRVVLPSPPDATFADAPGLAPQVGMRASDVKTTLSGVAQVDVEYRFNGQPVEHGIYQTRPGGSFVSLTFVDGVLTAFEDIGRLPDNDMFQGR